MREIVRSFGSAYATTTNTPARQVCLGKAVLKFSQVGYVADTVAETVLSDVARMFLNTETGVRMVNVRNVGIKLEICEINWSPSSRCSTWKDEIKLIKHVYHHGILFGQPLSLLVADYNALHSSCRFFNC